MGDIAVGQTKRIKVTSGVTELGVLDFTPSVTDTAVATVAENGDQVWVITGDNAGPDTIQVAGNGSFAGQSGSLDITVDPTPLTVELVDL